MQYSSLPLHNGLCAQNNERLVGRKGLVGFFKWVFVIVFVVVPGSVGCSTLMYVIEAQTLMT
jgi:hypothetical protein